MIRIFKLNRLKFTIVLNFLGLVIHKSDDLVSKTCNLRSKTRKSQTLSSKTRKINHLPSVRNK